MRYPIWLCGDLADLAKRVKCDGKMANHGNYERAMAVAKLVDLANATCINCELRSHKTGQGGGKRGGVRQVVV